MKLVRDALVLSPMVDVTDAAFRYVATRYGADVTCSEMVAAAGIVYDNPATWALVRPYEGESPYGVQIMGGDPDQMADAVRQVAETVRPDFIDLNLGCPSPNILRSCAGGFLLRDPRRAGQVIQAAVDSAADTTSRPVVTVKMRMGHDHDHLTYLEVGEAAQAAGAAWCTLHGRTVEQGYSGRADRDAIGRLVDHLDIPVIGNGDIRGPADVVRMRDETGCAGFFIARAAMHDPTIFRRLRQALDGDPVEEAPSLATRLGLLQDYLERAGHHGTPHLAVLKRQATRFVSGAPGAKRIRSAVHGARDGPEIARLIEVAAADGQDGEAEPGTDMAEHGDDR